MTSQAPQSGGPGRGLPAANDAAASQVRGRADGPRGVKGDSRVLPQSKSGFAFYVLCCIIGRAFAGINRWTKFKRRNGTFSSDCVETGVLGSVRDRIAS